ncbi:protein involved in ribonucleotide reduction [Isoptericola sp. CG 20/1183]|uniref:Protein NrdI n=1 Tax=Isoptericola halotolerans TaxID=300560 RepID=A0ABX5EBG0_9MICO|nr:MULTISPECIES: class Ib ribonucleoside-diphosphate reductase assembly flavoprotein NrdI [Isoptericola]MCK0116179.1 class Ib ribonucleoside-diphosphate reductase assembly flavoprotein NrdI [Isoptericola sp. S6320L]PRZ04838.1 protein involved in ribonucleotide reduction [Isoptericola halotolerans]PRZ05329.1 protein involved in ribonucleotide reduction [Isoptericola sp. CG 20/1183]
MGSLVYFSSVSENTHRFVQRLDLEELGMPVHRIPVRPADGFLTVDEPYVLMVPTYGGGNEGGSVPRQVRRFLGDAHNRSLIRGVIAAGNTNFGAAYCIAGDIISAKCQVPYLYAFELLGTAEDAQRVRDGLGRFWQRQSLIPA